jgi:hypothetical protein
MPKARPIECHHPVMLGHQVEQAARRELLDHAAIAVKEHDCGFTCATPDVMQPHAIGFDEISHWRIPALSLPRVMMHGKGSSGQSCANADYSSGTRHVVALALMRYHNCRGLVGFAAENRFGV